MDEDHRQHPDAVIRSTTSCRSSGNPNKKGMLFAGTGRAFYYSLDDGATWTRFKDGLPPAPVSWITVEPRFHDVVVSTYGRGLFILPNITLLEQTGSSCAGTDDGASCYEPAPIVRLARSVFTQAGRPHFTFCAAVGADRTGQDGDPRRERQGASRRSMVTAHQG